MLQTFKIIHGFDDVRSETWSGEHRLTRITADPLNLMRLELRANFLESGELMEQFAGRS